MPSQPEQHHIHAPHPRVPNSRFPVLVYRSVLTPSTPKDTPASPSVAADLQSLIESNHWLHGGTFKTYWRCHFHSVTHECYAVIRGESRLRLGVGAMVGGDHGIEGGGDGGEEGLEGDGVKGGEEKGGVEVELGVGDVIVLPAGVSHCSVTSEGGYEYLGLYPEGSPKYDNNFCKAGEEETRIKAETARKVPVPEWDPVFGYKGPLYEIWSRGCSHED